MLRIIAPIMVITRIGFAQFTNRRHLPHEAQRMSNGSNGRATVMRRGERAERRKSMQINVSLPRNVKCAVGAVHNEVLRNGIVGRISVRSSQARWGWCWCWPAHSSLFIDKWGARCDTSFYLSSENARAASFCSDRSFCFSFRCW